MKVVRSEVRTEAAVSMCAQPPLGEVRLTTFCATFRGFGHGEITGMSALI